MSRDVVKRIVNSGKSLSTSVDNVAVGGACSPLDIKLHPIKRADHSNSSEVLQLTKNDIQSTFFIDVRLSLIEAWTLKSCYVYMQHIKRISNFN